MNFVRIINFSRTIALVMFALILLLLLWNSMPADRLNNNSLNKHRQQSGVCAVVSTRQSSRECNCKNNNITSRIAP